MRATMVLARQRHTPLPEMRARRVVRSRLMFTQALIPKSRRCPKASTWLLVPQRDPLCHRTLMHNCFWTLQSMCLQRLLFITIVSDSLHGLLHLLPRKASHPDPRPLSTRHGELPQELCTCID